MPTVLVGYPVQHELNLARITSWKSSYNKETYGACLGRSLVHKELTLLCLITNTAATCISATAFVSGAAVLGTPKIVVFIATAGNVRPSYSTGCLYNGEVFLSSIAQICRNTLEIGCDSAFVSYKCAKGVQWTAKQLRLDGALKRIVVEVFVRLGTILGKGVKRIAEGTSRAVKHEPSFAKGSPLIVAWINEPTLACRINLNASDRPVAGMVAHTALSVINVPVNLVACCASGAVALPLIVLFLGKVGVNSVTNLDIPGPTFAGSVCVVSGKALFNVLADLGTIAADTGILAFKTVNIFRLERLLVTAVEFLYWSFGAIFS
jgi:hypothetical protein